MKATKICFVSSNRDKAREYQSILGLDVVLCPMELIEIQSVEIEEVAADKALRAHDQVKSPIFIEDTGLYFKGMNGLPGALIKHFLERLTLQEICDLISDEREAIAKTCIAYKDSNQSVCFLGEIKGAIADSPRGADGFGWDAIFVPEGQEKTFAEMTKEEKNLVSMRAIAGKKFREFLSGQEGK